MLYSHAAVFFVASSHISLLIQYSQNREFLSPLPKKQHSLSPIRRSGPDSLHNRFSASLALFVFPQHRSHIVESDEQRENDNFPTLTHTAEIENFPILNKFIYLCDSHGERANTETHGKNTQSDRKNRGNIEA